MEAGKRRLAATTAEVTSRLVRPNRVSPSFGDGPLPTRPDLGGGHRIGYCYAGRIAGRNSAIVFRFTAHHLPWPQLPHLTLLRILDLLTSALVIAFLAVMESLLSAMVADRMIEHLIDYEGFVEPRPEAKGPIARSLLYVHLVYGGLLPDGQLETALRWHNDSPTTKVECMRAEVILELQGTANPFLDCP